MFIRWLTPRSTFSNTLPIGGRMSLAIARTALQLSIRNSSNMLTFACIGAALGAQITNAQDGSSLLRNSPPKSSGSIVLQEPMAFKFAESVPASTTTPNEPSVLGEPNNSVSFRIPTAVTRQDAPAVNTEPGEDSKANTGEKKKEPIRLPALLIPNTSIQDIGTKSTPEDLVAGRLPSTMNLPFGADRYGPWAIGTKTWTAPVFCHQPTYFEDTMLESHGHERFPYLQPLVSGMRFYSGAAFLPYLSYMNPPLRYSPSYDHYRPGSSAPALRQRAPYDKGALRFQLLTTGATIFVAQP